MVFFSDNLEPGWLNTFFFAFGLISLVAWLKYLNWGNLFLTSVRSTFWNGEPLLTFEHTGVALAQELTERLDINEDHNDPKPVFIETKYIDDETDEDEEYQEPLIDTEESDEMISKHDTDSIEM